MEKTCTPVFSAADFESMFNFSTGNLVIASNGNESYSVDHDSSVGYETTRNISIENHVPSDTQWQQAFGNFSPTIGGLSNGSVKHAEDAIYAYVIGGICCFGLIGNILNMIVLTRKGLQVSMDRMEKSAHVGLVALAVSDMLFCLTVLPHSWYGQKKFSYSHFDFKLIYHLYSNAVINIFIMSSTWLTVAMATSRYLAICHPLHARDIIGMTFAKASIIIVFVVCVLFNLPRFWSDQLMSYACEEGGREYYLDKGFLTSSTKFYKVYMWLYFSVGLFLPLVTLAYCNINLIRALRQSAKMRKRFRKPDAAGESTHRITLTLVVIVVTFFVFVIPNEINNFLRDVVLAGQMMTETYNLGIAVTNMLQALNFSVNFVLYCIINVHFRHTILELLHCRKKRKIKSFSDRYDSLTMTSNVYTRNSNSMIRNELTV